MLRWHQQSLVCHRYIVHFHTSLRDQVAVPQPRNASLCAMTRSICTTLRSIVAQRNDSTRRSIITAVSQCALRSESFELEHEAMALCCHVALGGHTKWKIMVEIPDEEETYGIPDWNIITVSAVSFFCLEAVFQPSTTSEASRGTYGKSFTEHLTSAKSCMPPSCCQVEFVLALFQCPGRWTGYAAGRDPDGLRKQSANSSSYQKATTSLWFRILLYLVAEVSRWVHCFRELRVPG